MGTDTIICLKRKNLWRQGRPELSLNPLSTLKILAAWASHFAEAWAAKILVLPMRLPQVLLKVSRTAAVHWWQEEDGLFSPWLIWYQICPTTNTIWYSSHWNGCARTPSPTFTILGGWKATCNIWWQKVLIICRRFLIYNAVSSGYIEVKAAHFQWEAHIPLLS